MRQDRRRAAIDIIAVGFPVLSRLLWDLLPALPRTGREVKPRSMAAGLPTTGPRAVWRSAGPDRAWIFRGLDCFAPRSRPSPTRGPASTVGGRPGGEEPPPSGDVYENTTDAATPDRGSAVTSSVNVTGRTGDAPSALQVGVDNVHTWRGDLVMDLLAPDGMTQPEELKRLGLGGRREGDVHHQRVERDGERQLEAARAGRGAPTTRATSTVSSGRPDRRTSALPGTSKEAPGQRPFTVRTGHMPLSGPYHTRTSSPSFRGMLSSTTGPS